MAQKQPMYRQIAEDLRSQITSGALAPGVKLPTEGELSEKYEASRNTVRDAIRRLTDEGLIETRPGQGTFVTRKVDPFVTVLTSDPKTGFGGGDTAAYLSQVLETHRTPTHSVPKIEVMTAPEVVAILLEIPTKSQVVSRSQDRYIDEIPWSRQTSYYLMDFITKGATKLLMAQDIEEGTIRYVADTIGIRQTGYRDWITARLANGSEQEFFGIGHNSAVFDIFRIAFDQNNTPMRLTVTVYPVDRTQLIVDVGSDLPAPQYTEIPVRES